MVKANSHHKKKKKKIECCFWTVKKFRKALSQICAMKVEIGPIRFTLISRLHTSKTTKHTEKWVSLKISLHILFICISYFNQTK